MKIAIVGSGISGLSCAYLLHKKHDITVFESSNKPGGHVNTVKTIGQTGTYNVDTGFIVFNRENYPNFVRLLEKLRIDSQETRMGFSVQSKELNLEYSGESITGLFGHFRNLVDPKHWLMVRDILKFHKLANNHLDPNESVDSFLGRNHFGDRFSKYFLLPLGSALWSCSTEKFGKFPMEFVSDFLSNHQMLQASNRPIWRVIKNGSKTYVDRLVEILGNRLKLNNPVKEVKRAKNCIKLSMPDGTEQSFDEVILACQKAKLKMLLSHTT